MTIPDTDRIKAATVEARQGGCQLVDLIDWGTKGWNRVAELEAKCHLFRSALEELESFADHSDLAGHGHLSTMLVRQTVRHALNP